MARSRTVFSLSLVAAIALVALVAGVVGGRATASGNAAASGGGGGGAASGQKVDVIIRATDSAYWQTLLAGADAAAADFGITVAKFGPTSETDIAGQVQLVENSVSRGVNAIVIAPSSSEALNASIDAARQAGIKVITADTKVTADIEGTSEPTTSWRAPSPDNTCANCSRHRATPRARSWSNHRSPASRPTQIATPDPGGARRAVPGH